MSTYYHLRCLQHDPPLVSVDEVTQHNDEALQDAIRWAQDTAWIETEKEYARMEYFEGNAKRFLRAHHSCPLDIISEYGEVLPLPGRERT